MVDRPIDELCAGDVLAEDILDEKKRLLFPKGAILTEGSLRALYQRGVSTVRVADATLKRDAAMRERARDLARKYYDGHEMDSELGVLLLDMRTEAELQRLESGRPTVLTEPATPSGTIAALRDFPRFTVDGYVAPELPALTYELNQVLARPEVSSQDVADVVGQSPGLTAKLLRLVNSPCYGFQGKVETISRAVTIVGLREVGMLASGLIMLEHFGVIPRSVVDMRSFLGHSLGCALTARAMAEAAGSVESEQAFVAGLLHDVGRLFFFTAFPERSRYCIDSCAAQGRSLLGEERRFFGVDHASMGLRLLDGWRMPLSLQQAVAYHHDPALAIDPFLPTVVHVADLMAHAMGLGSSGDACPPAMRSGTLELLAVRPERLMGIATEVAEHLEAMVATFV